jgi:REP element-mobilizing transposase RayT
MRLTPPATRWCHLTWSTGKHHKFFNIAALARFCERALLEECGHIGWSAEAAILPGRIHVLIETPAELERDKVIRLVRDAAALVVKRAGGTRRTQRVWENGCWCSILTNRVAVEVLRARIRAMSH